MGDYLKMADVQRAKVLIELGWSYRRIEREVGVCQETVARYDPRRDSKGQFDHRPPKRCEAGGGHRRLKLPGDASGEEHWHDFWNAWAIS